MKFVVIALALVLGGCESARGLGALGYCLIHQNDINRKYQ